VLQTLAAWIVLPLTRVATDPRKNINWVFAPGARSLRIDGRLYFALVMLFFPLCVYLPSHWLLAWLFGLDDAAHNLPLF
jgi:hypothetical protein